MARHSRGSRLGRKLVVVALAPAALLGFMTVAASPASAAVGANMLGPTNVRVTPMGAVVGGLSTGAGVILACYDLGPRANGSNPVWYRLASCTDHTRW